MQDPSERIAKWLARAGVASRRDIEKMIAQQRISLNSVTVEHPATFVKPGDIVQVDGRVIAEAEKTRLWRYHKPEGLVTTHKDPHERPTVFDHLPAAMPRVVSVGRLDLNTEGLLLLTNDGGLSRYLELPSTQWSRRYRVRVYGHANEQDLSSLSKGITVDNVHYGAIEARLDSQKGDNAWLTMTLREGKNREIRRVLEALGLRVNRLIRTAYGPFQLGSLTRSSLEEVPGKIIREQIPNFFKPKS